MIKIQAIQKGLITILVPGAHYPVIYQLKYNNNTITSIRRKDGGFVSIKHIKAILESKELSKAYKLAQEL